MIHDIEFVIPNWNSLPVQRKVLEDLKVYAKQMGFTDKEIVDIRDRKILLMVYKAMMFDRMIDKNLSTK